ncbi:hypothetical protein AAG570_009525 [Ranatra chinensis]|uniref:Peptidase S8/S53 domain-containing protein n=1 Tax=Ranatra chinensis TaxID=642074 RepID=A0ABD0YPC2_9HEMI
MPDNSEEFRLKASNGGAEDGMDMNVGPAWAKGYTGKGVVVSILDDGIQTNHPDLVDNYSKTLPTVLDAPWYISKHTLHTNLNILTARQVLHEKFKPFNLKLETLSNSLVSFQCSTTYALNQPRRLKRRQPRDPLVE